MLVRRRRDHHDRAGDAVGQEGGAGKRVRGAARDAHQREPVKSEVVRERGDVRGHGGDVAAFEPV